MKINILIAFLFLSFNLKAQNNTDNDTTVYLIVEQMPEYPEGQAALFKWFGQNLKYPSSLKESDCQIHSFYLEFIVEKNGKVTYLKSKNKCDYIDFDKQLLELFKTMPKWKPGKQNGKNVRVKFTLRVGIKLE